VVVVVVVVSVEVAVCTAMDVWLVSSKELSKVSPNDLIKGIGIPSVG